MKKNNQKKGFILEDLKKKKIVKNQFKMKKIYKQISFVGRSHKIGQVFGSYLSSIENINKKS